MVSEEDSDFSRSFQNAVQYALDSKFKENRAVQEEALFKFIQRNDVFSVLTTGCGKSLIFQRVTIVCSYLYYHGFKYSMLHWLLFARRVLWSSHIFKSLPITVLLRVLSVMLPILSTTARMHLFLSQREFPTRRIIWVSTKHWPSVNWHVTDPLLTAPAPLLTSYKINGKMKIKKAQNYQWSRFKFNNKNLAYLKLPGWRTRWRFPTPFVFFRLFGDSVCWRKIDLRMSWYHQILFS